MEADSSSVSHGSDANVAYPIRCTEECLLPIFTDYSLQSIMALDHDPLRTPLSELRLVLLGRKGAGKSAAGNTILGAGFEFGKPTEECIKRRADVDGMKVTAVDTPGWEWYYPLNSTPNWVKRETLRSVTLCPPGPHAILLVIRSCASVNEDYIIEIEEHLLSLGPKVWEHTMVIFTKGDELGLVSMEQRIQTSLGLQNLLHKCGNRYHVMENRVRNDGTQVKQLIRKLKKMVEEKEGRQYLEINNSVLSELDVDSSRRARERRKKQRQMEAQAQRGTIKAALMSDSLPITESDTRHSFSKTPRRLPEVRLVILGERETGKSAAANSILGQAGLFQSGTVTEECVRHQATVSMRQVTLVDTPGWDGGIMGSTPERVKRELASSVILCQPGPHAFLVTLRVDTAIRESHVREHLELLGESIWRYTILLFTHCDQLREGVSIEQHIQKGGKDLQTLLEKCGGRYHAITNSNGLQNATHVTELLEKAEKMAATNRCEAFSGLVQEVKTLSRQRNEKQSQRLKELQDKMSRQEAELKKLRDREMKSLRWLFDWKKKNKSSGNSRKEEVADEDKRNVDANFEDLQERMRLLIDDKEREIQDLNVEHEKMLTTLHQSRREAEEAGLNAEMKEREIEELSERNDELQSKMLDLERIAVGHEQEKQRFKDAIQEWQKVVQNLQQHVQMARSESAEWKEKGDKLHDDLEQAKRRYKEEVDKLTQEKDAANKDFEIEMAKYTEMFTEKEKEVEQHRTVAIEEQQKALDTITQKEQELQNEIDERAGRHKKEIDELRLNFNNAMEEKICEMDNRLEMARVRHFEETEQILKQHQNELNEQMQEIGNLKEQLVHEAKANMIKQRELVEMEHKYTDIVKENSQEHEKEMQMVKATHKQEMDERENVMAKLKERYQGEIGGEKIKMEEIKEEFLIKLKEKGDLIEALEERLKKELDVNRTEFETCKKQYMLEKDREVKDVECKYMDEIKKKEKDIEHILKEKSEEIEQLTMIIEELKLKLDSMADLHEKLENKEQRIRDLKECLKEVEEKLQVIESTKEQEWRQIEQKLAEKELLIQMLNEKLKDIEVMLQKKEEERGQILRDQKKEAELQMEIRGKDVDEIKQKLSEETEKNAESEKFVEELTNEMVQIENELVLKEAEIKEAGKTQEKYAQEIEKLKGCVKTYEKIEEGYRNKELEMLEKLAAKDKDLEQMRLIIEQTKAELNELTHKMEKEMTSLIREYESGIERKNEEIEIIMKEKDAMIKRLEQDKQQKLSEVTEHFEKCQKRVEELEEKMTAEMQKAEMKCEQMREECEAKDKEMSEKESGFENICKAYKQEILGLGQINSQLQREKGEMTEDFERQVAELKQTKNKEENKMEKVLAQKFKEIEMWEKEKLDFEEKVCNFDRKQEELAQWEVALMAKQNQLDEKDCGRQKVVEQKERELEELLKALEAKQIELSFHGQDLQKKVRGLKDQGKELKHREFSLRNQEQELINWTSQLEVRNKQVSFTTQQLDEMGKDLASLKQELQHKDQKYRKMFDKLNKWEASLQEREAQLSKKQSSLDYSHTEGEIELMYQDIGETRKDSVQEMADSASVRANNYHFETLSEIAEQKESLGMQSRQDIGSIKAISGFKKLGNCPQNNKETSDLTILMLREAWSSRSPSGASILGGEEKDMSKMNGLCFRSWKGEIAGRQVSIVEPVGLKWKDCTNTSSENILEAVTWCESVPSVVLLVLPVFLAYTESCKKAIEKQVNLVGSDTWQHAMVLFTWGETLGVGVDQHIQRNAELSKLIRRCGGRYHILTSKKNHSGIARLFEKMDEIVALNKRDVPR